MTEADSHTKVVWHYQDDKRLDGDWTLCGIPKSPDPAGVAWPCDPCMAEHRRRREEQHGRL